MQSQTIADKDDMFKSKGMEGEEAEAEADQKEEKVEDARRKETSKRMRPPTQTEYHAVI